MTYSEALQYIKENTDLGISVEFAIDLLTALELTIDLEGMTSVSVRHIYNAYLEKVLSILF